VVCLEWWREWQELRVLPWPGDLLEQPSYVVDAIGICERRRVDATAEADAEARARIEEMTCPG